MKKLLKNRLTSMEAVYRFCNQYPSVWSVLPAFSGGVSALGLKIQSIINVQSKQEADNTGVAINKAQLKESMINTASIVAFSMQSYSKNVDDAILYNKLSLSPSALLKGKDPDAIATCLLVYNLIIKIPLADRITYNVSDDSLELLKSSIHNFESEAASTRNVISARVAYTKQLTKLVSEGNDIMRNVILKLGRQFINSNPAFYNGLRSSAKLITPETHTKIRFVIHDDVTQKPLHAVTAKVEGTNLKAATNTKGKCNIYTAEGASKIIFSKTNYISMTLNIQVKRGSNTINVQMSPVFTIPSDKKIPEVEKVSN
jgi:hypothetical protein